MVVPIRIHELDARMEKFKAWLSERGAEGLPNSASTFEVLRFRTAKGIAIIYREESGVLTFTGESYKALTHFYTSGNWRASVATPRIKNGMQLIAGKMQSARQQAIAALRQRDGDGCFYCLGCVAPADASIEHLVAATHQGPNHLANYALAHQVCNAKVGALSVMEKIAIRVKAVQAVKVTLGES